MKASCIALLCGLLSVSCTLVDERWEGSTSACSGNRSDSQVLLILDAPAGPKATGYFGVSVDNSGDDWYLTELQDGELTGTTLIFEAVFDFGSSTSRWDVELERKSGEYQGEVEIATGGDLVRCDMELDPQ